ncbi:MAG: hypothetical protein ACUVQ8_07545 [Nitrososphaeria archaeon]
MLANVFTTNRKVRFIFTGSYAGVVRSLLEQKAESPLHGRPPVQLRLRPFSQDVGREFLSRGMKEVRVEFDREKEVLFKFDEVVGRLALFGSMFAVRKLSFDEAMEKNIEEGKKIMFSEFKHFLKNKQDKRIYLTIMSASKDSRQLAGHKKWSRNASKERGRRQEIF